MRRMISDLVLESDDFLDLPLSAQALYCHCVVNADNCGFFSNINTIKRMVGATQDDVDALVRAGFLIRFPGTSTSCVKHWKMMNELKGKSEFPEAKLVRLNGGVYEFRLEEDDDEDQL